MLLNVLIVFLYVIAGMYGLIIMFSLIGLLKLKKHTLPKTDSELETVTVVICARDEEEDIDDTIRSLLAQDYPKEKIEFIFVDDRSCDRTGKIMDYYSSRIENIRVVHVKDLPSGVSPKKHALRLALDMSRTEFIATTDGDCTHSTRWLRSLACCLDEKTGVVTGITRYEKKHYKNRFERLWQKAQSMEHLTYSILNAGYTALGIPMNANGSNMIFRKELFSDKKAVRDEVVSGDDFFLVQQAGSHGYKVIFDINRESVVHTTPPKTFRGVIDQRSRWNSKILLSSPFVVFAGVLVFTYYLSTFLLPLTLIWRPDLLITWLILFGIKVISDSACLILGMFRVRLPYKLHHLLFMELFHALFVCFTSARGTFGSFTWKGDRFRTVLKNKETK